MFKLFSKNKKESLQTDYEVVSDKYIASLPTKKLKDRNVEISLEYYINRYLECVENSEIPSLYDEDAKEITSKLINKTAKWFETIYDDLTIEKKYELSFNELPHILMEYDNYLKNLDFNEKFLISKVNCPDIIYLSIQQGTHLHLHEDGKIMLADEIFPYKYKVKESELLELSKKNINDFKQAIALMNYDREITKEQKEHIDYLTGQNILDVIPYLEEHNFIRTDSDTEVYEKTEKFKKYKNLYDELMNSVMYRLIENDKTYGPRRALLFAHYFKCNMDIPVIYGLDYNNPGINEFLTQYLKLQKENKEEKQKLLGYSNYGNDKQPIEFAVVQEILELDLEKKPSLKVTNQ